MKIYKIVIISVALILLLTVSMLPTVYSKLVMEIAGWNDAPEKIEAIYGDFDIEINNTTDPTFFNGYYAYKISPGIFDKTEKYFVVEYRSHKGDGREMFFHIFEGTDWIEEVTKK